MRLVIILLLLLILAGGCVNLAFFLSPDMAGYPGFHISGFHDPNQKGKAE